MQVVAIAPFRAVRFDPKRVRLATATSPPHDCITPAQRDALLASDPHSIVQVVLGPERPEDAEGANRYTRARDALRGWLADGTMRRDAHPAFYRYTIAHGPPGDRKVMSGFLARLRIDPAYGEVRPHEKTLKRKKRDRLQLREETGFDCEPIWMLYRDRRGWVEELLSSNAFEELARFTDEEGHEHRLWRIDRPEAVGEIVAQFDDRQVVIADGHHRYQTALEHHAATGRDEDGSILVCLVRDNDPGTRIEATHRLLHTLPFPPAEALRRAERHWEVAPVGWDGSDLHPLLAALPPGGRDVMAVHREGETLRAHRLTLRPGSELREGRGRLDDLAVTRLHERLLRDAWGLDPEHPEDRLHFTRDAAAAVGSVRSGASDLALLLPPESAESVLEVASQGHVMPQKATYFTPKLRSGLVLSPLDEPRPRTWAETAGGPGKPEFRMPPLG
jgi:uncharacterized protein (DUF1015 family)